MLVRPERLARPAQRERGLPAQRVQIRLFLGLLVLLALRVLRGLPEPQELRALRVLRAFRA